MNSARTGKRLAILAILLAFLAPVCWVLSWVMGGAHVAWMTLGLVVSLGAVGLTAALRGRLLNALEAARREEKRTMLAERRLSGLREMIDELAEGLDTAICVLDDRGNIEYANRAAIKLFRFEEPTGRSILAVSLSQELQKIVLDAGQKQLPVTAEIRLGTGGDRTGIARAWPESADRPRVFLSIYDVTDLRRLERVRQDFVANVSHELRTPMSSIRAMAETLDDLSVPDPPLQKRYLDKIMNEIDRLTSIVDDLLLLSSAESEEHQSGVSDLGEIIAEVVRQLQPKAKKKKLELTAETSPEVFAAVPHERLTQIVLNLVDNAIKYTVQGSVRVAGFVEGQSAILHVQDTGIGIASEHQTRIFERFYRVDKGRSRASGGTGLGLSIVRHLVESYGGTIQVQSQLNRGSSFRVELPLWQVEEELEDFPDPEG
ncbi:MAG TPA: ATP-binding protein [Fimbriimonadaceae bacterium]|nr:ATP-binding protein [Fimbriimonadaceae bacterium]HRJ32795.1 ATP-binding protein [Fimbriimonadaceae bacterium]